MLLFNPPDKNITLKNMKAACTEIEMNIDFWNHSDM